MSSKNVHCILLVVLVLMSGLVHQPAQAQAASVRLRIGVTADNMYRITPADLADARVNVAAVDPRTFKMSSLGSPVAIRVTGDSDGQFNGTDRLEFFGQKFRGTTMEEKYTDERVYWLDIGGAAGPRIADLAAVPQNDPNPPADFATTVRAGVDMLYWNLNSLTLGQDTWFWDRFKAITAATGRSYAYNTPHPASGSPATLRVEVVARKAVAPATNPNHRVTVGIGAVALADVAWSDLNRKVISAAVPAGTVTDPSTTVSIGVQVPSPDTQEDMYFNYWELDYRRLFRAVGDRIDFKAETASPVEYRVRDFTSNKVVVWDITTPDQPTRLTGATAQAEAGTYAVRFRITPAVGDRYWLQTEGSFAAPASVSLRPSTGLRSPAGGADTVIVTPAFLRPAAETLAAWHRAHDRRTMIADLQDVYDEFNEGIRHPVAVRQMMIWASTNWAAPVPAYLVLMGDGHWNMKGFNPAMYATTPNPIPPYLIFSDPWVGEIPSDGVFGDITGDNVPDLAVGRIPVNTLAEADTVVNKITSYAEGARNRDWQRQAVFVAGANDPAAGDFPALSDEIIQNHLAADLVAQRIYMGTTALPIGKDYTDLLVNAVNSGALMVQWSGHGNIAVWSGIWYTGSTSSLTNGARLPVFMTFNCLDGYYAAPIVGSESVAETMLRHPAGGSVAAISPSGEGLVSDQAPFRKILMDTLFHDGVRELGRALLITKQDYAYDPSGKYPDASYGAPRGANYLVSQMNLLGDPAMRLPDPSYIPQAPDVTATRAGAASA